MSLIAVLGLLWGIFNPEPLHGFLGESDKTDHTLAFMVVAVLGRLNWPGGKPVVYWGIWCLLAVLLEYLQGRWMPLRTYDIYDAYANLAGVLAAFLFCFIVAMVRRSRCSQCCHELDD
ncbi:hypothetical protein QKW35_16460 [Pontibacterium granulatum]|uniref:hypothetical protein n=1 Tax=Pontibacterium granulatum TaxID=2036029 RepID=UPI00249B9178|nr:hypothetical protein [Pontibacterium granulatum]MDI3325973.1 hypothetical protein [Pontibacterium granulatum]